MIYLITGLPGNGKTLYALWHLKDRAEKEKRPVFYSGIPDLALDWIELDDPEQWHTLPEGAIVVIDEAQRVFRPRPGRGEVPVHVSKLETHRHSGHDLYLITQHPTLIDQSVRRLAGVHRHIVRTFGLSRAVIHEWGEVHLDCERRRGDSSKTTWNYPKNIYSLYKSAEVHTHRLSIPKQVWYLLGMAAVLIFCIWHLYTRTQERITPKAPAADISASGLMPDTGFSSGSRADRMSMTKDEYIASLEARIPGLPHTAPRYDDLTVPTDAPYPVGCYTINDKKCKCVTQQGTPFKATDEFCRNQVAHGFFKDWGTPHAVQYENPDSRVNMASLN